jgi:ABC-type sugar transport system substrate-binding protein
MCLKLVVFSETPKNNIKQGGLCMKKVMALVLLLSMILLVFAGCANQATTTPTTTAAKVINLKFAWVVDNVDISQQNFYDTATKYCDFLNATRKDIHVELQLFDGQASVDKQISDIENAVTLGVDGIILSCVDPNGIAPAAKAAMKQGVKILDWRDMGDICDVTFVGANEEAKGQMAYEWAKKYLTDHPDVVWNAGLQQGSTAHPQCFPRMKYMYDLQKEMPSQFKILVEQNSDWSADTSQKMAEDWLQAYPTMNFLQSSSEEQMLGCIAALKDAKVADKFVTVAFNGEQPGVDMIKAGTLQMDVGSVMPIFMGKLIEATINMVLDGLKGHIDISKETMYTITSENVAEYEKLIQLDYMNKTYFPTTLKASYSK